MADIVALQEMFPHVDAATLQAAVKECKGNVEEAASALLLTAPSCPTSIATSSASFSSSSLEQLRQMFPAQTHEAIERALRKHKGDVAAAATEMLAPAGETRGSEEGGGVVSAHMQESGRETAIASVTPPRTPISTTTTTTSTTTFFQARSSPTEEKGQGRGC